jgi:hypothetical protein
MLRAPADPAPQCSALGDVREVDGLAAGEPASTCASIVGRVLLGAGRSGRPITGDLSKAERLLCYNGSDFAVSR